MNNIIWIYFLACLYIAAAAWEEIKQPEAGHGQGTESRSVRH